MIDETDKIGARVTLFGRVVLSASISKDGAWWIDDTGFCRYRQIVALMLVSGERPWSGVQLVVGPVMIGALVTRDGYQL